MTALIDVLAKLRSKRRDAHRSAFGHYLEVVRKLASGAEIDADECSHVLGSADRDETALERDVNLQQQRTARAATLQANQQAAADQIVAQNAVADAQRKLQDAYDRLQPAVAAAHAKLADANFRHQTTMNADAWLADPENILDRELLEREAATASKLRKVCDELRPLLDDQDHLLHRIANAEFQVERFRGRTPSDWYTLAGLTNAFHKDERVKGAEDHLADLRSQAAQLSAAIKPRQVEQARLQNELNQIHQEKLKP